MWREKRRCEHFSAANLNPHEEAVLYSVEMSCWRAAMLDVAVREGDG